MRLINIPLNLQLEGFVQVILILLGLVEVVTNIPVGSLGAVDVQLSVVDGGVVGVFPTGVFVVGGVDVGGL
ncbi:MAG TPA: hypothetical protein PLX69_21360, partial [Leptospiraceae bacterium]|nr:hypothetical protein [Leptospiraceae bacterium]